MFDRKAYMKQYMLKYFWRDGHARKRRAVRTPDQKIEQNKTLCKKRRDSLKGTKAFIMSEKVRAKQKKTNYRDKVFAHYGSVCVCCGESDRTVLAVDHKDNTGYVHRNVFKVTDIARYLCTHGFTDEYQILCFNCNWAKVRNGGRLPEWRKTNEEIKYGPLSAYAALA